MIESLGDVPLLEPMRALSLLVALPLAWALACFAVRRFAPLVALLLSLFTVGTALYVVGRVVVFVVMKKAGGIEHVATVARLGRLDLRVDFVADARSALIGLAVAIVGILAVVAERRRSRGGDASGVARRLGWTGALVFAGMIVTFGDGLAPMLVGTQLATLATFALATEGGDVRSFRSLLVALSGDGALALAACLLFWGLGGTFGTSGWTNDPGPRAALVAKPTPGATTLVVPSFGGARVTSYGDVLLPGEPLVAPFVSAVTPGVTSFRIALGPASPDVAAPNVTFAPGRAHVVVPLGPTTSLREVAERMRITAAAAKPDVLASRVLFGAPMVIVLAVLFGYALVARLVAVAAARSPAPALGIVILASADIATRAAAILGAGGLVLASSAAAGAVLCAAVANHRGRGGGGVATIAALTIVAAGLREPGAAVALATAGAFAVAAGGLADERWSSVAAAVSVGLLPGAGVSAAVAVLVTRLLALRAIVLLVLVLLAVALAAMGSRRNGAEGPRSGGVLGVGATLLAVAAGPILGVGAHLFGGGSPSLADRALVTSTVWPLDRALGTGPSSTLAVLAVALVTAAAALGWTSGVHGRRRAAVDAVARPATRALALASDALGRGVFVLVRGVVVLDHEVLDDLGRAIANAFAWTSRAVVRASTSLERPLDHAANVLVARVGLDDPRASARAREIATVAAVGLPVLLVLSSWLLG